MGSKIIGTGISFPPHSFDNEQMSKWMHGRKSAEWITEKLHIMSRPSYYDYENRRRSDIPESKVMTDAAIKALEHANMDAKDIDAIIINNSLGGIRAPDPVAVIHRALGCKEDTYTLSLYSGCIGTLSALHTADKFIKAGVYKNVLIVASSYMSETVNEDNMDQTWLQAVIFGDGAGALVVTESEGDEGFDEFHFGTDHDNDVINFNGNHLEFDFRKVPVNLGSKFPQLLQYAKENFNIGFPGQTCLFNNSSYKSQSKFAEDHELKTIFNIDKYGNAGAASLALVLDEYFKDPSPKNEDILLMSVGTGLQFGCVKYKFPKK